MKIKNHVLFKRPELLKFCILRFLFGIAYSFMIPIIPLFLNNIGISTLIIGTIMSLYGVSKAIVQIPFGFVSDTIGDKLLLMIALGLMAFIPFSYTLTSNQMVAGGIYILQGAILGIAAPATFSILARSLVEEKRGECTGLASAVFTLGGGIGAAIGGFILAKFNSYNLVFYTSAIGIALSLVFVIFNIHKSREAKVKKVKDKKVEIGKRIKQIFDDIKKYNLTCKIIMLGAIAFLGDFIFGCVVSIFPFYGQDVLGGSVAYTSAIISIYLFVFGLGAPIAGWVSDKIGNKRQLLYSFLVMNGTLLGLGFTKSLVIFTIIIVIYFLGATFLNASLQSILSEFGEDDNIKGIVFGFVGACEALGYAVGPIYSAYIYDMKNTWLFFGVLGISLIVSVIYLFLCKKVFAT